MGPGQAEKLIGPTDEIFFPNPNSWSPDGSTLAFSAHPSRGVVNWGLWTVTREGELSPIVQSQFQEAGAEFSPNGQWLAYTSGESGRVQVYVRPFPGPGPAVQISNDGGLSPVWSRNGRELYFRGGEGMQVARVEFIGGRIRASAPELLFDDSAFESTAPTRSFDVAPDGRLLFVPIPGEDVIQTAIDEIYPDHIRVVQNWTAEVEAKFPTDC